MNVCAPFIRRPVATTLVMLSILLFGGIGYRLLPVSDLPNVDFPVISVTANLPGANAETMSSAVATPLEKEFSAIAGLEAMSSTSRQGSTGIDLTFGLRRDVDACAQDVQIAISRAVRRLPSDMPAPPSFRKVNPSDYPILIVALTSPDLPLTALDKLGETMMAQRISMVDGVAQVAVYGAQKYAVRIGLDPLAMNAHGVGVDQVTSAIREQNVNLPLGTFDGPDKAVSMQANGQLLEARRFLPLIVGYQDGHPLRLSDIGSARDGAEDEKHFAWFVTPELNQRAIVLAVQRQPGSNTVEVAEAVKRLLPTFQSRLPASVTMSILRDKSLPILASTEEVESTLTLTLALVVLVIFLFLRNLSATVIPSLTLPMSIVGTFAVMYLLDYSLDNLSLMALTLSVGFVVDDAIVMLENIVRHMELGKARLPASLDGSREIAFTIVSMTLSLAAVFLPVLFLGGVIGRLFREFAVTIGLAVLISGFVSLTLTPMLCSRFLRDPRKIRHGPVYQLTERGFAWSLALYERLLRVSLRRRGLVMLGSLAVLAATAWLFVQIPKGFVPSEDLDSFNMQILMAEDSSFDAVVRHQQEVAKVVRAQRGIKCFMSAVGSSRGGSNTGRMYITLLPRGERELSVDQIIEELRPKLARIPGVRCFPSNPPPIPTSGHRGAHSLYQLTLMGGDTHELFAAAQDLEERIRDVPGLQDVNSDLELKNPQLDLRIDRDRARVLGVTPARIEEALYTAYGLRQVSTIYAPDDEYAVIVELEEKYQRDLAHLWNLHVRSMSGKLVPLAAVVQRSDSTAPLAINHTGQLPSVTLSFNLKPGASIGPAVDQIDDIARRVLPGEVTLSLQGTAQQFASSQATMGGLLVLAIVVIYVVLGILYESFIHPLTILTALPFAGFGALVTLMAFRVELSIYAFVGIIMLVGLVKKNGIMMVDFALAAQREQGKPALEAIFEACVIRFRPIMMTTMAALMASIPIAVATGAGAESRRPLGLTVVGGLLFSQALTLFVTPVFYVYMDRLQDWLRPAPAADEPPQQVLEEVPVDRPRHLQP